MRLSYFVGAAVTALGLTACPTIRPLDSKNSENLQKFGPNAVASSTQFLKGSPVEVNSTTVYLQQLAQGNPQLEMALAKAPKNLSALFSSSSIQSQAGRANPLELSKLIPAFSSFKLQPQAGGNDCGPASPPLDSDGDGIPNLFTYTFDCGGEFYDGKAAILTGTVSFDDLGDNDDTSGYNVKFTNLIFAYIDATILYGIGTNLDTQVRLGSGGKYGVKQTLEFAALVTENNKTSTFEYVSDGTLEFTPQANAVSDDRFARGTLKFNNKFAFKVNNNGDKYESSLQFSSTGMLVDRNACGRDKMVIDGDVKFTDSKNTLTWSITGCGVGAWNYQ
jgi:hypothetical protein